MTERAHMRRYFIDVREPFEYAQDHVEGSINIPPSEILSGAPALSDIPKDAELILYCASGARSNASMHYLREMGFKNLVNGINKDHVRSKYSV